jgi:HAD superfamily hydrolase (TIGR01509 family)
MFDAVIFDCDGCLIDSEVLALEVELEALAAVGMNYERAEFCRRFMGLPNDAFFAALDADRLAALGAPLPADFRRRHGETLTRAVDERLAEVAGAAAAVAALGRPKAVASSSHSAFLERKLRRVGLWEAFAPHIYAGDQVARGKPAPDLFLHAAAALGAAPGRCLAIEDSVNGVAAARAAGMTVWALTAGGHMLPGDGARLREAGAHALVAAWADAARDFARWG